MTKHTYTVYKSKLDRSQTDIQPSFKRIDQLYLELLENKSKVQPHLVNTEYKPTVESNPTINETLLPDSNINYEDQLSKRMNAIIESYKDSNEEVKGMETNSNVNYQRYNENYDDVNPGQLEKYRNDDKPTDSQLEKYRNDDDKPTDSQLEKYRNDDDNPTDSQLEKYRSDDKPTDSQLEKYDSDNNTQTRPDQNSSIEEKLHHILSNDKEVVGETDKYTNPKKTPSFNKNSYTQFKKHKSPPIQVPSISQLQQNGDIKLNKTLRNAEVTTLTEQQLEDRKRETIFKFQLLKKSYPSADLPEYTVHSDLNMMQRSYESHVRRLSLDSTVETYKTYLTGSFMLIQYIFGKYLKFDMDGYAQQQIMAMNSYERLLIELGEKTYVPDGSKWPVEVRLVFLVLINTAFFIISKMIMKSTGANLINMINGMNTAHTTNSTTNSSNTSKRKMKGPTINIDDLK